MRLGVITPVLTMLPRAHARWEETAGIAEVERVVVEAERLGYDHVTCSEHVAIPRSVAETRGATYWDPLSTFGYLAARTRFIPEALLPLLRRTFSSFNAHERRQMGERAVNGSTQAVVAETNFDVERAKAVLPLLMQILNIKP